jgi:hypothetical protein
MRALYGKGPLPHQRLSAGRPPVLLLHDYGVVCAHVGALSRGLQPATSRPLDPVHDPEELANKLNWIGYSLLTSGLVLFCTALSGSQNPYRRFDAGLTHT